MKKILSILLTATMLMSAVVMTTAADEPVVDIPVASVESSAQALNENQVDEQGVYYSLDDESKTAIVGKNTYADTASADAGLKTDSIVIPETVTFGGEDYTVVAVGRNAFNGTSIREIVIPCATIGEFAFAGCTALEYVYTSATEIKGFAFWGCTALITAQITTVDSIGGGAFWNCSNLQNPVLGASVIMEKAFEGCAKVEYFVMLGDAPSVGADAFDADAKALINADAAGYEDFPIETTVNDAFFDIENVYAKAGETVIISVNPAADHILKALSVRTSENKVVAVAEVEKNIYSFVMPEFDVTVSASFKREAFDVNIASVTGGTVAIAEPGTYKKGETVTLTVAAKADYKFKSLSVKSGDTVIETKNNGATYTFTMPAAEVEVKATFEAILYDLTIATASNGTVKTADNKTSYVKGTNVELVIEPAVGYELEAVIVKDTANKVLSVSGNKFEMPSGGASVSVTFKKSTYNVNVNAVDGVLIKAGKETAQMGDDVTLEVTESAGYKVTKITFTGADGKEVEIKDNKFTMPASNVTITAVVEKIPYTVDIKKDSNINYFNGVNVSLKTNRQYTVGETVELVVRNDFQNYGFTMKLTAKDAAGNELEVKDNKFTMPASDVEINYTLNFPRFP